MKTKLVVAVLDVMWGPQKRAARWFYINPDNLSGKRLYSWVGDHRLVVTNACPQIVRSARGKGVPDPQWLTENLEMLKPYDLLLVCGVVAQRTFVAAGGEYGPAALALPHPAARTWTRETLASTIVTVQEALARGGK